MCPLLDFGFIGPTTSSPHWENGCSTDIGCNDIAYFFIFVIARFVSPYAILPRRPFSIPPCRLIFPICKIQS
jgi:hypothetical protein